MAKWGRANTIKTETIRPDGDDENFLEIRVNLTKAEANRLMEHAPMREDTNRMGKTVEMLEACFEILVVDWSAEDEDGNKLVPTIDNYRSLDAVVGRFIDETLSNKMSAIMGIEDKEAEGKLSE